MDDTLEGGQQLIESDLQKKFGISRSPLREAFRNLEKNELVDIIPRKGTFVKKITRKNIAENIPVRAVLEGLAAKKAYQRINEQELKHMEETLRNMKKAVEKEDTRTYWKNHLIFHKIFINASRNDTLINILNILRMHSNRYKYSHQFYMEDFAQNMIEHEQIYNLFRDRERDNSSRVAKLVQRHIDDSLEPFLKFIENNNNL